MKYKNIVEGIFLSRPNRFIAYVEINGQKEICHVKNTGRCRELLVPGATVYLQKFDDSKRKTKYDLISVVKNGKLINMDSQAPNKVAAEFLPSLFPDLSLLRAEVTYGSSRFDFYIEAGKRRIFVEVKGVTLEQDGAVYFPDAPTERGIKHLKELSNCLSDGFEAYVLFVIQMSDVLYFSPNDATHAAFGDALRSAKRAGVEILAYDCEVTKDALLIRDPVRICL